MTVMGIHKTESSPIGCLLLTIFPEPSLSQVSNMPKLTFSKYYFHEQELGTLENCRD